MSVYDNDNYYITFGERRQSCEEWIAFGDETDGEYDPSYDAASGSDCVTGYTHFPGGKTDSTAHHSPQPQQSGCMVMIKKKILICEQRILLRTCEKHLARR